MRNIAIAGVLLFALGCGGDPGAAGNQIAGIRPGLDELNEVYQYRAKEKRRPPAKLADLDEHEPALPNAWPKLVSGEYVVIWGVSTQAGSPEVLAYEKEAPSKGGQVLLRNGTVKAVTAAEYQALPKAGR